MISKFSVQCIEALDGTSPYKIRGEQIDEMEEKLMKKIEDMREELHV